MSWALEVRGLNKSFGGLQATRDVNLQVAKGELHGIIGPNGAGKTTLISQLFGEVMPDAGHVYVAGRDITHLPTHARARMGIARSFQITALVREFSVLQNMLVAVMAQDGHAFRFWKPVGADRRAIARAEAALAEVGLAPRAHHLLADLSHGEQRRLELAIALLGAPAIVLLDEPMAGLGHEESREMMERLARLKSQTTVLLVEHDMEAVFGLADRVTVLVRGEVVAVGTPEDIRANPVVREVYLGEDG